MSSVWGSYNRKEVNISKATYNSAVNALMEKHYKQLHSQLVKSEQDQDTFNDTFLKLTYNYNPEQDFIEQFKYYFKLLKGAYYRDDRIANYFLTFSDVPDISYTPDTDIEIRDKVSFSELKQSVLQYANFKKTKERTNKAD